MPTWTKVITMFKRVSHQLVFWQSADEEYTGEPNDEK